MNRYVIIGGGVAAVGCIEGIRKADTEGSITLISGEKKTVYCRPLISYYLQGKTDFEKMKYRSDEFYEKNNCKLVYDTAVSIDKDAKTVTVSSGEKIPYDKLCVATGSSPFVPPFTGLDNVSAKFSFMTEDDAAEIEKAVDENSRVLIVGAGLIGLKCAEGLCGRVKSITVCDLAERVLSSILDEPCAKLMQNVLEENGISFMLGDSAEKFDADKAYMKSGAVVDFDVLILAVGVRANVSLVKEIGGETERGIIIDEKMKTSVEDIYAVGDCSQGVNALTGQKNVLALLPNAVMQGETAGQNMAGADTVFDKGVPMNAIGFFGYHALTAGIYEGEMTEEKTDDSVKRLFVKDNRLVGFMLLGDIERAGIYTSLIREKTPLDTIDAEAIKISPSLLPFSLKYRKIKLGGSKS
ncbi:MAG: FAD-dependent oxidoreductase [Ruminococcus sp.]|nr:FAD-dependent oxidoreductase [Ruminococcus sp.]